MVGKKLDEVFSSLKDNFILIFSLILLSVTINSCERSFQNFDQDLLEKKKRIRGIQWKE